MNDILLQINSDSVRIKNFAQGTIIESSFWFLFSIIEFFIILIILFKLYKKNKNLEFSLLDKDSLRKSRGTNIDMNILMANINNSSDLYKKLCRVCHPDRFVNSPMEKIAEEIFQEISRNKRNYEKLAMLKTRAINELNINFE
jgi:hypothetical protein